MLEELKEEKNKKETKAMKYDFIQKEIDFINENARFNDRQQEIFNRLTDKRGRQKVIKIALEMNLSERTVEREIKAIKNKIYKIL